MRVLNVFFFCKHGFISVGKPIFFANTISFSLFHLLFWNEDRNIGLVHLCFPSLCMYLSKPAEKFLHGFGEGGMLGIWDLKVLASLRQGLL